MYGYYKFLKIIMRLVLSDIRWIEWIAIIVTIIYVGWLIYLSYLSFNVSYKHYCDCDIINTEYSDVCTYIMIAEQMLESDIYSESNYDKIKDSINYLKYYFIENQSIGLALVAKLNTSDYLNHLNIITNYIGKIDYLISISDLLSEGYLIPDFITASYPVINISNMWNPMIGKQSIHNSINMNVMTPNIMIVTGPNKSGKSTYMRSILLSVYLAQSLGICCADKMTLTPFRYLCTYINIKDCIAKESLFEAEIDRCYKYTEKIESLNGFSIGIIDELFTGTNSSESKAGTYAIIKRISKNPTNITIMSTHFVEILDSFDQQNVIFNKFVGKKDVKKDKYIFDYKVYAGISNQYIALELMKSKGFDNDIIVDAYSFLLTMHKNKEKFKI
jgi:DNA mismatch repair ATPase MutS